MENMVRPESTARLTVTHRPTMFTYRDLKHERQKLCLNRFVPRRANESGKRAQVCSHLCVSQGFAGDVALHLRLVDGVDGHPHDAAADHNGPESVSPQRIWVKAKADGILKKTNIWPIWDNNDKRTVTLTQTPPVDPLGPHLPRSLSSRPSRPLPERWQPQNQPAWSPSVWRLSRSRLSGHPVTNITCVVSRSRSFHGNLKF